MEILFSVAAKVAEYTVAPIGRQVGYLISYKANFKKLTDHVKELEDARDEIIDRVEEERRNGSRIKPRVQKWLDRVGEVIGEANKLQEDPGRAKVGCSSHFLIWCYGINLVEKLQKWREMLLKYKEQQGTSTVLLNFLR